jgi:ADP-ribose pyrophosphatase YjhB (NUDIX family)
MQVSFREAIHAIANKLGVSTDVGINPGEEIVYRNMLKKLDEVPYNPYPVAFHTVDIIVWRYNADRLELLLGRKPFRTVFQFIGGFLDPTNTAEDAAVRETFEETKLKVQVSPKNYLGSFYIDDYRYKESCHKITSSLFEAQVGMDQEAIASDDIAEVKWFDLEELELNANDVLLPTHHQLLTTFLKHLEG